jgi:hypothetical protein
LGGANVWEIMVRSAAGDYLTTSPWILSFIVFVFGPVVALRLITLYYTAPAPHWRIVYPYEYSFNRSIFDGTGRGWRKCGKTMR